MKRTSTEMKKKIVIATIQDGHTVASLATEYGISTAFINIWIRDYRKECQATSEAMSELAKETLETALSSQKELPKGLMLHSDQGSQFAS